jgi:hypothetical protein
MPKKPRKLRPDVAENAYRVMLEATGQAPKTPPPGERTEKNPEAVARGSKGGKRGGKARAENLPAEERSRIAEQGAATRWSGRDPKVGG